MEEDYVIVREWLAYNRKQYDWCVEIYREEKKRRSRKELMMLITCFLSVLYIVPHTTLAGSPSISIPAISFELPLSLAVAAFPTAIAALYLVYVASGIDFLSIASRRAHYRSNLDYFIKNHQMRNAQFILINNPKIRARIFFLPTSFYSKEGLESDFTRATIEVFIGIVFTTIPFAAIGFLTIRAHMLLASNFLTFWNFMATLTMFIVLISTIFGTLKVKS
jgi:hypothetical protein